MPELPDIAVYVEALRARALGATILAIRVHGPAWLRTAVPPLSDAVGRRVTGIDRLGKRIVLEIEGGLFAVLHLMVAGRLRWREADAKARPGRARNELGSFELSTGTLVVTEAGTRKRASLHLVAGAEALAALDPGGLEVEGATREAFAARLRAANHTLKRALSDPHVLSGVGNAYSDEILHAARLSPFQQTRKISDDEMDRLYDATRATLAAWTDRLRAEAAGGFPERVTAFRPEMAVHGRFREPCPACGAPIQRIAYAENEANYCARCQTGGRILADRALSRLLHDDWPRTLEEMEERRPAAAAGAAKTRRAAGARRPARGTR